MLRRREFFVADTRPIPLVEREWRARAARAVGTLCSSGLASGRHRFGCALGDARVLSSALIAGGR
jgi:hypothetical protein